MGTRMLPHDLTCAAQARRCVADELRALSIAPDSVDDVLLVISELVTNAVLHAARNPSPLGFGWSVGDHHVTVCVDDADPRPPTPRAAADADLNGRGLAIVSTIASEWGVSAAEPGKRVWARVPVERASAEPAQHP